MEKPPSNETRPDQQSATIVSIVDDVLGTPNKDASSNANSISPDEVRSSVNALCDVLSIGQHALGHNCPLNDYVDWLIVREILLDHSQGYSSVAGDLHSRVSNITPVSGGTVRARVNALKKEELIRKVQNAGRAHLHEPTPKLIQALTAWTYAAGEALRHHLS